MRFLVSVVAFVASVSAAALKVQLSNTAYAPHQVFGFTPWQIADAGSSATTTLSGVKLTLSTPSDTFKGGRYKVVSEWGSAYYGEHVVGIGLAPATTTTARALQLQISGLSAGTHTLRAYHNAWDNLSSVSTLNVAVNGTNQATGLAQSVRKDSFYNSASSYVSFSVASTSTVTTITWTSTGSGTDKRPHLNGFEFDEAPLAQQVKYPEPLYNDEHVNADSGSVTLKWQAASSASSYRVYTSTTSIDDVIGQTSPKANVTTTSYSLTGIDYFKTYFWRVDVVRSDGAVVKGTAWRFKPRVLAFPGADGFGKYAYGGRGGKVIRVTNLNDSGSGSFRAAVEDTTGPRIIVFDVGGKIVLKSRLSITDKYITVAGQTAPGKGVVFTDWTLGLSGAYDTVVRHLRVRPGKGSGATIDGMGMRGSNFAIFDRCSISWTIDESFSSRDAYNITLQRTLISEPLNAAGHQNYPAGTQHGYAASIGGDAGTFHHNLIAHANGRSWSMAGGADNAGAFKGRLSIVNNVVYNFGTRVTDGGAMQVDFIGNYYKPGAASKLKYTLQATYEDGLPGKRQYYCIGNMMLGVFNQTATQVGPVGSGSGYACYAQISVSPAPTYTFFMSSPFMPNTVEQQTATEAYKRVMSDAGAWPVDNQDTRIVKETLAVTYTYKGSYTGLAGLIDDVADVGGMESWPSSTKPSWDTVDSSGLPTWWDGSTGGGKGWYPMDGYLNWMAEPHQFIAPGAKATIALADFFKGFSGNTYTATTDKGSISVSGSTATFTGPTTATIARITLSVTDSAGSKWSRPYGVAVICALGTCGSTPTTSTGATTTATPSSSSSPASSSSSSSSSSSGGCTTPLYGQCGGIGFTGCTTCAAGSSCTYSNDWYSQCL